MDTELITEKPSERIRFALEALREAERPDAPVKPDMNWYHQKKDGQCFACLGGLAALKRFDKSSDELMYESIVTPRNEIQEYERSLDAFRTGDVDDAFFFMGLSVDEGEAFNRGEAFNHRVSPDRFHSDMHKLADDLEAAGY